MTRDRDTEQTLSPLRELAPPARRERARGGQVETGFGPLVPRTAGEILDAALDLLCGRAAVLIGVCTLLWLPVRILQSIVGAQPWETSTTIDEMLGQLVGTAIVALAGGLVQSFATAVVTILVFHAAQGEPLGVRDALRHALRRFPGLVVIAILTGIAATIGMVLCVIPYFLVAWKLALAPSIYVIEGASVSDTLRRSFLLTTGSFLRWAGLSIVTFALVMLFSGIVGGVDHPLVLTWLHEKFRVDPAILSIALIAFTSLFMGIVAAVGGVVATVFYVDCLVRRDGLDLRSRIAALAGEDALARAAGARA